MTDFQNNLEKSIFVTLAYFDIFDYPLTSVEIWKWLYKFGNCKLKIENSELNYSLADIQKRLEESNVLKSLVDFHRGFYFLRGRENLLEIRQERYNLAEEKFKKVIKVIRFLKLIPGVRMIAVCNDLAWSNAPAGSDIDLFIVTASHKIWSVRFWMVSLLKLFKLRPTKNNNQDKICLSFFVDEENLNLEPIAINQPDIYLIYWIAQVIPIYDVGGIYEKFLAANTWVKKYLPNSFKNEIIKRRKVPSVSLSQKLLSVICFVLGKWRAGASQKSGIVEKFFRWLQLKIMPAKLKKMANQDSRVIINNGTLKFHQNDRREEYKKRWLKKIFTSNTFGA